MIHRNLNRIGRQNTCQRADLGKRNITRINGHWLRAGWTGIQKKDAYGYAAIIMTDDFNIASGLAFKTWPEQNEKKIGPLARKSVRVGLFIGYMWMKCITC